MKRKLFMTLPLQIMANKGHKICTFDSFNLTEKEYLMYLFKYNILQKELYGEELK